MASKKDKKQFLWGDDDTGIKSRGAGTNLSNARFSTRDFSVDQSVNLMAMGDQPTNLSGHSSSGSGFASSVAGLFRAKTGTEGAGAGAHFDEYGDAAPSTESEEYITDKQRRVSPMGATFLNCINACSGSCFGRGGAKKSSMLLLGILGAFLLGGGIYFAMSRESEEGPSREQQIKEFIIENGIAVEETFEAPGSNPRRDALTWLANTDPAQLSVSDKGFLDRYILAVFYYGSNDLSEGWTNNENWMTGAGICSWAGVECLPRGIKATEENNFQTSVSTYDDNDSVTAILLGSNNVGGTIPEEFSTLHALVTLDLSNNKLTNPLPDSLRSMFTLRTLLLNSNAFTGTFPESVTELPGLHQLNLGGNKFEGTLPTSLGEMFQLRSLGIASNLLSGEIPSLEYLAAMINLYVDDNAFTGTIPDWIANLSNLKDLRLAKNKFSGTLPSSLLSLVNLETLHLDNNGFVSSVPEMFDKVYRLTTVQLHRNLFTGAIPRTLWHLTGLKHVTLDNNKFTGSISGNIGTLEDLQTITMHVNELTGTIPTHLGNLEDITSITLNSNKLTGTIPTELGNCYRMVTLRFDQNKLTGSIPTELGLLEKLVELRLDLNSLTGSMPAQVCTLATKEELTHLAADCKQEVTCSCCHQCV